MTNEIPQCIHIPDGSVVVSGELFDMACAAIAERDKLLTEIERLRKLMDGKTFVTDNEGAIDQLHAAVKTAQELAATRLMEVERLRAALSDVLKEAYASQSLAQTLHGIANEALTAHEPLQQRPSVAEILRRDAAMLRREGFDTLAEVLEQGASRDASSGEQRTDHAENLAKALEHYLKAHDTLSAVQDTDEVSGTNEASDCGLHDAANDAWRAMRTALYEYRKHGRKAAVSLPACECLLRDKAPSAYHNVNCPRYVADLL